MPNVLGNYNEIFFAEEALIQLFSALGLAARVHRDFDATPANKGDTIRVRRPSTFAAADEPSNPQDLNTDSITVTLNKWRGVKFALTDKELTLSASRIIEDHVKPAAYEIARDIDADLQTLVTRVPWVSQASGTFALSDLTKPRQVLFDNGCPMDGNVHLQIDGGMEANILGVLGGANILGAGVDGARRSGDIGQLYGMNIFASQTTPSFLTTQMADVDGTVVGAHVKGATSLSVTAMTASQTGGIKAGDTLVIAGNRQRYTVTAQANTGASGEATLTIEPGLAAALAGGEVVSLDKRTSAAKVANLAFHRNFACLAMAPLSTLGAEFGGVRMATATDPKTGLALRSRMYYDAPNSKVVVSLDALWGKQMLDHNLACRFYSA